MHTHQFDNRFINELPADKETQQFTRQVSNALWSQVYTAPAANPTMLAYAPEVADMLGFSSDEMQSDAMLAALSGNSLLEGMQTYATRYGGHQFGHWAGQLGDGRATFLGELVHDGKRYELQLKGAGKTPYSRRADGLAVLRSSLREFLCSEAMHHLGVPTTRALSLGTTGNNVMRDMFYDGNPEIEQGAITCRVAPSFTRFGHFQMLASAGETALLKQMISFTIDRDFTDWLSTQEETHIINEPSANLITAWFKEICERTAFMVAEWMRVGFVHGVMNTDNMSILGLTIDYGPYGWVDNFEPGWTPNTTDAQGKRYCFGRQGDIARWNLERLADALLTLLPNADALDAAIAHYDTHYMHTLMTDMVGKFGLDSWQEQDGEMINKVFELMTRAEVDMTLFFTHLAQINIHSPNVGDIKDAFYTEKGFADFKDDFIEWLNAYATRISSSSNSNEARIKTMQAHNPRYVLRNYLAQEAIDLAEKGDTSMIDTLLDVLRNPYSFQPGMEKFEEKRPEWARHKAGCSMLSCSS